MKGKDLPKHRIRCCCCTSMRCCCRALMLLLLMTSNCIYDNACAVTLLVYCGIRPMRLALRQQLMDGQGIRSMVKKDWRRKCDRK